MSRRDRVDRFDGAIERLVHDARDIPTLPERVGRMAGRGPLDRDRLVAVLERAFHRFPPFPDEVAGFELADAIDFAETNLRHARARSRLNASNALILERDAVLAEARVAEPRWRWAAREPRTWRAEIEIARLRFRVLFWGGGCGDWNQSWDGDDDTDRLIDHLGDLARQGILIRTGLFSRIDRALGEIISAFMSEVEPDSLRVDGLDARRNAHNLATYGAHAPEGYAVVAIRDPGNVRATPDGVIGIRIVRGPASVPAPRA